MLHFIGFRGDEFHRACRVFGRPDFVHVYLDHRAIAEIMPGDRVVFANGAENKPINPHAFNDSERW